jgi:predicted amidohydrolase
MTARADSRLKESDRIFGDDPLLLAQENQEKYRNLILKNLLINRTLATSIPWFIDLHSDRSRQLFLKRRPSVPPRPSEQLVARYYESYRDRTPLRDDEKAELQKITMLADAKLTNRRKPRPPDAELTDDEKKQTFYSDHDTAEKDFKDEASLNKFRNRFRIATIGHRVRISKLDNACYLNEVLYGLREHADAGLRVIREPRDNEDKDQLGRTRIRQGQSIVQTWEEAIEKNISKALDRRSQIILLPEFALPPALPMGESIESKLRKLSTAAKYDHFLQAGTRHETRYNRGLVLSNQGGGVCQDWWHYKAASAKGLHENIMGPYGEKIPTYVTELDNLAGERKVAISVAVCYDAFDPTMFLSLLLQAFKHEADNMRHLLLVPSFNPSSDFVALLRDFSFLARCIVVYVNALHGDAEMFISGFSTTDFADKSDEIINGLDSAIAQLQNTNIARTNEFSARATTRGSDGKDAEEQLADRIRRQRLRALTNLSTSLRLSQRDEVFKHIVTYEACPRCGQHADGDYCRKDTLYFNIDASLIGALDIFRSSDYFDERDILPEPYWESQVRESVKWQQERIKRRRSEYEGA